MAETYTKLEYIQSTGTQFINSKYAPSNNTRIVMDVHLEQNTDYPYIFGVWTAHLSNMCSVYYDSATSWTVDYGTNRTVTGFTDWNKRQVFDLDGNKISIGGSTVTLTAVTFSQTYYLYLLAHNSAGSAALHAKAKLYSCQIYDNGTLVRDFVPAKRNSDGAIGLLDQANNVFYANAGTGTFTAGPEIVSTGSLANIDGTSVLLTGCIANVGGIECAIPYALANVDGIEVVVPFGEQVSEVPVGEFDVGETVWMNVNGTPYEWIIVHQGLPSSLYDSSCDGTWLLMKDGYEKIAWNTAGTNSYKASSAHSYLNGEFLNLFDSDVLSLIKTVKIPYVNGDGTSAVTSGSNGLSTRVFWLSGYEVGWTTSSTSAFPIDGACLSYFSGTATSDSKRKASMNGSTVRWWTRSPVTGTTTQVWIVGINGQYQGTTYLDGSSAQVIANRPAIILSSDAAVDGDGFIVTG